MAVNGILLNIKDINSTKQTTVTGNISTMPTNYNGDYEYIMKFKELPALIYFISDVTFRNSNGYDVYYWGIILPKIKKMLGSFNHWGTGDDYTVGTPNINGNTVSFLLHNASSSLTAKSITYVAMF